MGEMESKRGGKVSLEGVIEFVKQMEEENERTKKEKKELEEKLIKIEKQSPTNSPPSSNSLSSTLEELRKENEKLRRENENFREKIQNKEEENQQLAGNSLFLEKMTRLELRELKMKLKNSLEKVKSEIRFSFSNLFFHFLFYILPPPPSSPLLPLLLPPPPLPSPLLL